MVTAEAVYYTQKDIVRFIDKVHKEPDGGCWLWTAGKKDSGHGIFWVDGKSVPAHAFSHVIHGGNFKAGPFVRHVACHNPACVNPKHLKDGTHQDNMADMVRDGTQAFGDRNDSRLYPERLRRGDNHPARLRPDYLKRGEQSPRSKLKESDVLAIRKECASGLRTMSAIGRQYGIRQISVKRIATKKSWAHIP